MPSYAATPTDEPEAILLAGEPIVVAVLPSGRFRWRLPLSSHPSSLWQLAFQDPQGGSGRMLPRMVNFDRAALTVECDEASLSTWLDLIQRWIDEANAEMAARAARGLRVVVDFLPDCGQWCWQLRLGEDIIESSWSGHWLAYPSRSEATKAGAERLTARCAERAEPGSRSRRGKMTA